MKEKPIVGITIGDPCGIGPEITVKSLNEKELYEISYPLVIGDKKVIEQAMEIVNIKLEINVVDNPADGKYEYGTVDILDLQNVIFDEIEFGKVTKNGGKASYEYVEKAALLAIAGEIDAIATGPISKEAINVAGFHFAGHTEILGHLTETKDYCMMLTDKDFRVSHVTTHVAMKDVPSRITKERVLKVIELTDEAVKLMGVSKPRIAVAGFNCHSGENGLFGDEEIKAITPAIEAASSYGIDVEGPVPPDTVFVKLLGKKFDAVVAMYHDQGHIPTKLVGFKLDPETGKMSAMSGVNLSLGMPIIRASVDHGVAYDVAGKGIANHESLVDSVKLAAKMAYNKGEKN